jgi:hypothetical protein
MGKKSRKGRKKEPHEVTIPPGTAPGSKLTVPLPDGRNLTLTTPPGSKPGDCISLKEVDRAKNGHPSIALASGRDVGAARDRADALQKLTNATVARLRAASSQAATVARLRAASSQADVAASRSAVARPPAGIPPPGRAPTPPASSMPLTEDEKCALMQRINGLTPEKLDLVVATLEETSGAVTPSGGGDGSRVDLNALDPTALRSLQQFVNILSATQPLTLSSLASMPAEHQKNLVGERLYPLVRRVHPELAGKITGMLLELDNAELLHLIETPDALRLKVDEAIQVLKQWHQDPSKPVFPIVVKAEGEDVMLEVVGSLTIHQVKQLLNGRVPAPPIGRWGIIFKGVVLEDGRTLASYDIQTNSELILMPIVGHPPDRATATPPPSTPDEPSTAHRQQVLRQQQQRLLLLLHASKCPHKNGKCPVTPHCAKMKRLWDHIKNCKDQQCRMAHCVSSRYVLSHYHRCKDQRCKVCGPVQDAIRRNGEKIKRSQATATSPPPPASKPVEDQILQARRISIAAAVAEAAAKDIPPGENPNSNQRFTNAFQALMSLIAINDDDQIDLLEYAMTLVLSVGPVEYVKKMKRWPRLRKYWPRLRRRFCSYCGKGTLDLSAPRLMVCGGCGQGRGVGRYCSEACQRAHWPEHQKHCPRLDL